MGSNELNKSVLRSEPLCARPVAHNLFPRVSPISFCYLKRGLECWGLGSLCDQSFRRPWTALMYREAFCSTCIGAYHVVGLRRNQDARPWLAGLGSSVARRRSSL